MDSLSSALLKEGFKPFTDAGVNTDGESGELMFSLLVSLLGQRSVICSSEWSYLKANRMCYFSFICLFVNSLLPGRLFLHSLQFLYFS